MLETSLHLNVTNRSWKSHMLIKIAQYLSLIVKSNALHVASRDKKQKPQNLTSSSSQTTGKETCL